MGTKVCFIPLVVTNRLNSSDVNCGPFTETRCSGIPFEEKHYRRHSIVFVEVVEVTGKIQSTSNVNQSARETFACFSLQNRCGQVAKHVWLISKDTVVLRVEYYVLFRNLFFPFYVSIQPWTQHIANYFIRIMP